MVLQELVIITFLKHKTKETMKVINLICFLDEPDTNHSLWGHNIILMSILSYAWGPPNLSLMTWLGGARTLFDLTPGEVILLTDPWPLTRWQGGIHDHKLNLIHRTQSLRLNWHRISQKPGLFNQYLLYIDIFSISTYLAWIYINDDKHNFWQIQINCGQGKVCESFLCSFSIQ